MGSSNCGNNSKAKGAKSAIASGTRLAGFSYRCYAQPKMFFAIFGIFRL
jgi:hypothetical protein